MDSASSSKRESSRTITSPNGEIVTFVETASDTGGRRVVFRLEVAPGARVPLHSHDRIEETFELVEGEGEVELQMDGRRVDYRSGPVTVPPGHVHAWRNTSQKPAVVLCIGTPGAETEYFLRLVFQLTWDGYLPMPGRGAPKRPLVAAVFLHRSGQYLAPLPRVVFDGLIAMLAALGRWRGCERFLVEQYPDYARFVESRGAARK